ncbi:unnamed protein product [Cuscuta campestris]|uniref:TCP domain-containing protein n=1 Tax=Cuscuta campestris TaxID=132261 RepID=A0A484NCB8_9ASTE|nr:unnamed protein product [Cuscuta campestris]
MGENRQQRSSRFGMRSAAAGEIVEVQGGHIVRSTGRKDRHSKVCTAKGPRDRRVRLAAHTAIQFYDVQDRLGYDRPSKAVDWLIKKAKPAIDELAELPAWKPRDQNFDSGGANTVAGPSSSKRPAMMMLPPEKQKPSSFLPPSLDSDAIADTIKSFFPMGASEEANSSSSMHFPSFGHHHQSDLLPRTCNQTQDLRLSLQSFQDPTTTIILHHHQDQQEPHQHHKSAASHRALFDASGGWSDHHQQRFPAWNAGGEAAACSAASAETGGFLFSSPHQPVFQQLLGGPSQYLSSQRGPLQSSYSPSIRAWMDQSSAIAIAAGVEPNQHYQLPIYPSSSLPGLGFSTGVGDLSGFRIPARIQGEEEHDGMSDRPSSASSDSRR